MSIRKVTEDAARRIIISQCKQWIEDAPIRETPNRAEYRIEDLTNFLTWLVGARLDFLSVEEIITTLENLDSIEAGTYPGVEFNATLTIDNRPELREELNELLDSKLYVALQIAGFRPIKEDVAA